MLDVARSGRVLVQLVLDRIDQRLPARLDHVAGKTDRAPAATAVGRFDQHAHARPGAGAIVEHADLVVGKLHRFERRIIRHQRAAQRRVERVDRAVADGRVARAHAVGSFDHHHRFAERRLILVPLVVEHAEADEAEVVARETERAQHQQLERGVGAVESVAQRLQPLELVEQHADLLVARLDVEAELLALVEDVGAPRELREHHVTVVADRRRVDMLVGVHAALDAGDVQSGLVREGAVPDVGLARMRRDVRQLVDQHRDLAQRLELARRHALVAELELKVGDDRDQVGVAAALAEAVDRALDLHGAAAHGGDRVGDRDLAVVVRMDSDRASHRLDRGLHAGLDFVRQAAAVGVAKRNQIDSGRIRRTQAGQRELGIGRKAVEEMFGVEDDLVDVALQVRDRVVQDLEVGLIGNPQRLAHVHVPGLADHGRDRSLGAQQQRQVAIGRGARVGAPGRAEGRDLRVAQAELFDLAEERGVALVGARPSALDIVDPEIVEALGNLELVLDGERDVLRLAPVAQRGVVDLYFFRHSHFFA